MRRPVVLALVSLVALAAAGACRGANPKTTAAGAAQAAAPAAAQTDPNAFTGTVAETMASGGYTYARLQAPGKEDVWIAATEFATTPGDRLTARLEMPMANFESKTLKRTFPLVYFVAGVSRDGQPAPSAADTSAAPKLMTSHGGAAAATVTEPIAPPAGGMQVADVWLKKAALAGKEVTVRGKVVKVNNQIMGRNWIHIQDGSGAAGDRTNDLTITTDEEIKEGETVTVTGVVAVGKDFGAGYVYDVIVENGKVVR